MAGADYDVCLSRVLAHEGGYTNHPADPGGPTNFGITIYDYRKYVKPGATAADVRAMKVEEAKAIYRSKYWNALRCDELPAGVDDAVFDYGVNSGVGRAGKVLRRVLALRDNDWHVSDEVLAALSLRDPQAVIIAICDERLRFLKSLKTWPIFGAGWGRRVAEVKAYSLVLAGRAGPIGKLPEPAPSKGAVPPPKAAKKIIVAGGGSAAAGSGGLVHWMGAHPYETGALVFAGAIVIGGAVYALNRWHRAKQEAPTPGLKPVPAAA